MAYVSYLAHNWRQDDQDTRAVSYGVSFLRRPRRAFAMLSRPLKDSDMMLRLAQDEALELQRLQMIQGGQSLVGDTSRMYAMRTTLGFMESLQATISHLLNKTFCHGLSPLMVDPEDAFGSSLTAIYRPFYDNHTGWFEVFRATGAFLLDSKKVGGVNAFILALEEMANVGEELILATVRDLHDAEFWSAAYDLYYDKPYQPRRQPVSEPPKLQGALLSASRRVAAPLFSVLRDSTLASDFYPRQTVVPVIDIQARQDIRSACRDMASSKVLALDIIVIKTSDHLNISKPRIAYVLLASEATLVILRVRHNGLHNLGPLKSLVEDPTKLKVGVNMGFVQRYFSQQYDWDPQSCLNLAGEMDPTLRLNEPSDPTSELLGTLAQKYLGLKLPPAMNARDLLTTQLADPLGFYRYLAMRAYMPLQLYWAAQTSDSSNDLTYASRPLPDSHPGTAPATSLQSPVNKVELGPIYVGDMYTQQFLKSKPAISSEPLLTGGLYSQAQHLRLMSNRLAMNILQKAGKEPGIVALKHLQAYYLLTTFNRPVMYINRVLAIEIDYLGRGVLEVAEKFSLPLHEVHRNELGSDGLHVGSQVKSRGGRKKFKAVRRPLFDLGLSQPHVPQPVAPADHNVQPSEEKPSAQSDASSSEGITSSRLEVARARISSLGLSPSDALLRESIVRAEALWPHHPSGPGTHGRQSRQRLFRKHTMLQILADMTGHARYSAAISERSRGLIANKMKSAAIIAPKPPSEAVAAKRKDKIARPSAKAKAKARLTPSNSKGTIKVRRLYVRPSRQDQPDVPVLREYWK